MTKDLIQETLHDVDYRSDWASRWAEGRTGWDQGAHHGSLPEMVAVALKHKFLRPGDRLIEPGCGRAHGGAYLAKQGFNVTSFDITDNAMTQAKALYGLVPNLKLEVNDALKLDLKWKNQFHGIYDRAMLCALSPLLRPFYIEFCHGVLSEGGILLSLLFSEVDLAPSEGPPFGISCEALEALVKKRFEIVYQAILPPVSWGKVKAETMVILRKLEGK